MSPETPPPSPLSESQKTEDERMKNEVLGTFSPPSSSASPSLKPQRKKRKRARLQEYEIEDIVGYHRDNRGKMWYFVKWKGWSRDYNTFEPIENLTSCHLLLMRHFEFKLPSKKVVKEKDDIVTQAAMERNFYKKLMSNSCTSQDINMFLEEFPGELSQVLETKNLKRLERRVKEEYMYIIRCLLGMCAHQDVGLFVRGQNYKLLLMLIKQRRKQLGKLSEVEKTINELEKTEVRIVNEVDLDTFPDFNYIVDVRLGVGVDIPNDPLLGCDCETCKPKSNCCGKLGDSIFAYTHDRRLRTSERVAIYECNKRCRCPPTCSNRVVQNGRKVKLCIFKTKNCGWGVKAGEFIPKGTFVCEYIGELIPDSEANARDVEYRKARKLGYTFDLDFCNESSLDMFCMDATKHGNLARFINHSCNPNLVVYPVWVDCLSPNMHRLAFFARRKIREGEEIHFDYENLGDNSTEDEEFDESGKRYSRRMVSNEMCHCNSSKCRKWVFGSK